MANDLTKTPLENLLLLINTKNPGINVLASEVTFGVPAVETGARNTSIVAEAVEGSRFLEEQTFFYNRLDFQAVFDQGNKVFEKTTDLDTIAEVITLLETRYKIKLTTDDYTVSAFPTFTNVPDEEHAVTFTAKPGSLVWIGSGSITLKLLTVNLADALPANQLDGLTYEYTP